MKFRFNTYNNIYIMINKANILLAIRQLEAQNSEDKNEILQEFIDINNSINIYIQNEIRRKDFHPIIYDVAIDKNSKIGKYLLANEQKPKYITIEQIINALLVCVQRNNWQYYDTLSNLITTYGQIIKYQKEKKNFKIGYEEFKQIAGEEVTNYIVNNREYNTNIVELDKKIYLYENQKLTKRTLTEPTKNKTKKRTIN